MFCKNCGTKLNDDVKFCNNCGMAQESLQPEIQKVEITMQEPQPVICKNCGVVLKDGVKFCSECGTATDSKCTANTQPVSQSTVCQIPNAKSYKKTIINKWTIGGIVMVVFGFIAIYGVTVNGMFEKMSNYGADLSDIVTILLESGLVLGGAYLAYRGFTKKIK